MKPKRIINVDWIKDQKRGILRILLSLGLQENTQSIIIRKLNSHARYSRLRVALYEYNNIFKTIHILNLIDDIQLRKAIRTARNRTEIYNSIVLNKYIYENMVAEGVSKKNLDMFTRISPIAWAHILFTGKYKFKNKKGQIDVSN